MLKTSPPLAAARCRSSPASSPRSCPSARARRASSGLVVSPTSRPPSAPQPPRHACDKPSPLIGCSGTDPTAVSKRRGHSPSNPPSPTSPSSQAVAASAQRTSGQASSSKRPKANDPPPKLLPRRYELCAAADVVELVAHMLAELMATNDAIRISSGGLTRFHSRTAPGISVRDYLHRLARHATLTPPLLLAMVYYIDRLCALYQDFTINTLTVHRFLITAATVASKGLSDSFWNNTTYARVGGVRVAELKTLELEFLYRVDWKIVPDPEVLVAYYRGLIERTPGYALEPEAVAGDDAECMEDDDDITDGIDDGGEDGRCHDDETGSTSDHRLNSTDRALRRRGSVMRVDTILAALFAAFALVHARPRIARIYVQPIEDGATSAAPNPLAEISYDMTTLSLSSLMSYEAPEIPETAKLVRIGLYDASSRQWLAGTTVAAADNFSKGYSPQLLLVVDSQGGVVSVSCKGVAIDAGHTRDFGPKLVVLPEARGAQPQLNKPVVLSPEGSRVEPEQEKTFLQK
ncbi:hypothetical protein L249_6971 [Ophiocordyceps polyrhachis-furcata BCC 54312]|uniref:Cyclin-like domain-containing protein n=1 Tax=Ophiocordyceps polyrhachis-furcata BCC 54312 TaxID=1330021 RepID=A0A367LJL4_9HYPO|nr:hypothetical protein L249_6971 [Ophiocordyceps polyrhachis-furcata BCC 54312]